MFYLNGSVFDTCIGVLMLNLLTHFVYRLLAIWILFHFFLHDFICSQLCIRACMTENGMLTNVIVIKIYI